MISLINGRQATRPAGLPASRAAGRLARGVRTLFPTSFYSLQPMRNPCAAQVPDAPLGIPRGAPSRRTPTGTGSCGCVRGVAPCAPFAASLAPPRAPHAPRRHPTMRGLADKRVQAAPRASWAGAATRGALQIQGKGGPVSLAGGCRVGQATRVRVRGARPNDTTASPNAQRLSKGAENVALGKRAEGMRNRALSLSSSVPFPPPNMQTAATPREIGAL